MIVSKCQLKKYMKKVEKTKLRLTEKFGILFSNEPTQILIIANGGLANDVKRQELELSLSEFMNFIKEIITPPHQNFCFIISTDCEASEKIFKNFQSFYIQTPDFKLRPSVNAFCIYVEHLPSNLTPEIMQFNSFKPNGFIIVEDFISKEEEINLVKYFTEINDQNRNGSLKQRTVIHFGYEFNYENNLVDFSKPLSDKPIPSNCLDLLQRLSNLRNKSYQSFNQLTVNIYQPGDGIPSHTDTHSVFTDEIISFSLNSDIIMEWINTKSNECTNVDIKSRSVCIMSGESRFLWKHGIAARKSDLIYFPKENHFEKRHRELRVSLTFRQIKPTRNCSCQWPENCDFNRNHNEKLPASQLEQQFVHQVYEKIAEHFSSTRHSMWPKVRQFINNQSNGSIGADIGCGNGKYFPAILARGFLLGSDSSGNLCRIATDAHRIDTLQSNCLQLPYRTGCCDYFISIAVLHHLSTANRRQKAVEKMVTLLRKSGTGLIYVWAQQQHKDGIKSKYLNKKSIDPKVVSEVDNSESLPLPVHLNRTEFTANDMLVPWCNKSADNPSQTEQVLTRYYHLFQQDELENLCGTIDGVKVVDSWYDSGNWAVVIEKL